MAYLSSQALRREAKRMTASVLPAAGAYVGSRKAFYLDHLNSPKWQALPTSSTGHDPGWLKRTVP
jgi:hypothetical protein